MKKAMKKLMAALLAVAMVCAMVAPAWAAGGGNTLTINGTTAGHTYEAYQVFTGTLHGDILSDIQWGNGVDGAAILKDTELPSTLQNHSSAAALAAELEKFTPSSDEVNTFAKVVSKHLVEANKHASTESDTPYTITGLPDGYYFIKDATASMPAGATYSRYMLSIVKDVTIKAKDTTVTLDKQIKHNETGSWGVVGDNQIGDTVEFRTITTVPDVTGYTSYTYEIHDTMSKELTSNVNSASDITIKVNNSDAKILGSQYYDVDVSGNTFTVTVKIIDAVNAGALHADDNLYTYYTGVLNESAKVYDEGNQNNEAYLVYSNKPGTDDTGETPKKKVYDWTFKVDVTKVDGTDHTTTLKGAVFVLSETSGLNLASDENGTPTDTSKLIPLVAGSDGVYTVANTSSTTTYTMTTPVDGKISIKGLDDHKEYYLYETKAPDGYNTLTEPVKFKVNQLKDAAYATGGSTIITTPTVKFNGTDSGSVAFNVENNRGTTLPGTGGIGTTIFYIVGGGLMVAAGVLLITKKRMENR